MYEKQTWNTGDTITEEKLNHIEEGVSTGGGIYSSEYVTYFDGEVTTESGKGGANFGYIDFNKIPPEKEIQVAFNGNEYTLPYVINSEGNYWGELDLDSRPAFSNYPIFIGYPDSQEATAYTAEAGTYSLTIKSKELQINNKFKEKLNGVIIPANIRNNIVYGSTITADFIEVDEDLYDAFTKGCVYDNNESFMNLLFIAKGEIETIFYADPVPSSGKYLANDCQGFIAYYVKPQLDSTAPTIKKAVIVKEGTATFKNSSVG